MKAPLPTQSRPDRVLRFLAVVFTVAAVGSVVLVAVDMVVGRPTAEGQTDQAKGDLKQAGEKVKEAFNKD
jgi:hypothetical protein